MFRDRESFYHSKEWHALLETLKNERVNSEGELLCEYCQKPIVRKYDIIGHHKEELTEENVFDANIALNPQNIALVHHSCHNRIHDKLGYKCRQVFLVYGAPLSGKHTWIQANTHDGDLIVDMDAIWQCISGLPRYSKPKRLNAVAFRMRDELINAVKYRLGRWSNAYVVGGYPLTSERERICKDLGAREVFIEASEEECIERLKACGDGREFEEWKGFIERWFEQFDTPATA